MDFNIEKKYLAAEMLPFEREKLYNWIKNIIKPTSNILETGTGVGGSTYYLSKALKEICNDCKVYTCDPSRKPTVQFLEECDNVEFYPAYSNLLINYLIKEKIKISYIFFDGPEDPSVALDDIKKLEEYIDIGCYFSMHDWETSPRKYDNGLSTKAASIRPYMESSKKWEKVEVLDGINSADSVGLCLYRYTG